MPTAELIMSQSAWTTLNESSYIPPSGFVTEAMPATWISSSVTPGTPSRWTFVPGAAAVVGPPALGAVVVLGVASFFELPQAATAHNRAKVMAKATGRRRGLLIGAPPLSG